ncbi:hypothetical protein PO878_04120 [Iamia majanohamensis]|uniref:Uncharacterized protein n=1 Tax=Iamia majanohamensis TaxID=467976 RepID=A0AAE9Y719_9ACTN|nr:hypothetical protein [Iamia majanohamensis]WCO67909.1 hypothetical protein PO878_04120 [Iamia majanohamensis]
MSDTLRDAVLDYEHDHHPLPPATAYSWCQTCGHTLVTIGNRWVHRDGTNDHAPHPPELVL